MRFRPYECRWLGWLDILRIDPIRILLKHGMHLFGKPSFERDDSAKVQGNSLKQARPPGIALGKLDGKHIGRNAKPYDGVSRALIIAMKRPDVLNLIPWDDPLRLARYKTRKPFASGGAEQMRGHRCFCLTEKTGPPPICDANRANGGQPRRLARRNIQSRNFCSRKTVSAIPASAKTPPRTISPRANCRYAITTQKMASTMITPYFI